MFSSSSKSDAASARATGLRAALLTALLLTPWLLARLLALAGLAGLRLRRLLRELRELPAQRLEFGDQLGIRIGGLLLAFDRFPVRERERLLGVALEVTQR